MTLVARTFIGFALAAAIALVARATRSLSTSGAAAAVIVGSCSVAAGWDWGALLLAFFVSSTILSKIGEGTKAARTAHLVEKGNARDATQVLANGGIFAVGAVAALFLRAPWIPAAAIGALAVSTSDTWATEVGTLIGGSPRSILGWRELAPGTSGGITGAGTMAAVLGAFFIAQLASLLGRNLHLAAAVVAGGVAGSTIDSVLGARWQSRRWCDRCDGGTERRRHDCGAATRHHGGWEWLDNDAVNLMSGAAGALVAAIVYV